MLVTVGVLSFGFWFTHRMIQFQMNRKPLSGAISKQIIKTQILFFWFLSILSPWISVPKLFFFLIVPNLAATRLDWILNLVLRHQFQQNLMNFVDELILLMMTGKSFRDSFLQLTTDSQHFFNLKMRELLLMGHFQNESWGLRHKELVQITELVQSIEKNPHRALDRLRAFRRQLHWALLFKRKSKQATVQIRAQALILSLLYGGLSIFVFKNQSGDLTSIFVPSLTLFTAGLISLYFLGKRQAWKT